MSIINVSCVDQVLTITNSPVIASGGVKEDYVQFTFCQLWDGYVKSAAFWNGDGIVYNEVIPGTNLVEIPYEVLREKGKMYFGVFGVKGDVTRTSNVLCYSIEEGAVISESEPTQSVYEQILALLNTPVTSVNGKTGAVTLRTSDLQNNSGYLTTHPMVTMGTDQTYNLNVDEGNYFTYVSAVTKDSFGHVKNVEKSKVKMPIHDTSKDQCFIDLETKVNSLFYKPGDVISCTRLICNGYLSGTSANIGCTIFLDKPLLGVSSATFSNPSGVNGTSMTVRIPTGGYIWDETIAVAQENGTVTLSINGPTLRFTFVNDTAFSATNNIPVSITFDKLKIAFS